MPSQNLYPASVLLLGTIITTHYPSVHQVATTETITAQMAAIEVPDVFFVKPA